MRIKVVVPVPVSDRQVGLRAAQIPPEHRDADTEVVFEAVKNGATQFDSEHDVLLSEFFVYEAAVKAQQEGFDAVCIDSTGDGGMAALRSRLEIPVMGAGISGYLVALMLGHRFSVITESEVWSLSPAKYLRKLGLESHLASVRYVDVVPDLGDLAGDDKDTLFPALEKIAHECIEEDGAEVIVLGSTTMHEAYEYLRERLPVPVISPGLVQYKLTRMLVELGLTQSERAYRRPGTPKDDLFESVGREHDVRPVD
jgi:allantoin racemase